MKFALITEGASEHRVLSHILYRYLRESDPIINQIQPLIVDNVQKTTGGWNEVLKYCENPDLRSILIENDYLIIQIDTDQSETDPFNINHSKANGVAKTTEEIYIDVKDKLCTLLTDDIKGEFLNRIIFAICVHSIECWLLPIYYNDSRRSHSNNCIDLLNRKLRSNNIHIITHENKNKANGIKAYDKILKNLRKKSELESISTYNHGFKTFLEDLNKTISKPPST